MLVGLGSAPRSGGARALSVSFVTSCVGVLAYAAMALLGFPQAAPAWTMALACGLGGLADGWIGAALQPRLPRPLLTVALAASASPWPSPTCS